MPRSACTTTSPGQERETIRRALERTGGVKKDAAELMGISQRALGHYLLKYRDSL
ncbi:MAG: helix-turn-helix domain-containing protein [Vicinamibacterales bacterium]